jgi:hypothetical protein
MTGQYDDKGVPSLVIANWLEQVLIIIYWTDFSFTRYRLRNFRSSDIFDYKSVNSDPIHGSDC